MLSFLPQLSLHPGRWLAAGALALSLGAFAQDTPAPAADNGATPAADAGEIVALVHPSVEVDAFKRREVRAIYMGSRQNWKPGARITVLVQPDATPASEAFYEKVLKSNPVRFHASWQQLELSGSGVAPRKTDGAEQMVQAVAATPGAIGYALRGEVPTAPPPPIKVLDIEL